MITSAVSYIMENEEHQYSWSDDRCIEDEYKPVIFNKFILNYRLKDDMGSVIRLLDRRYNANVKARCGNHARIASTCRIFTNIFVKTPEYLIEEIVGTINKLIENYKYLTKPTMLHSDSVCDEWYECSICDFRKNGKGEYLHDIYFNATSVVVGRKPRKSINKNKKITHNDIWRALSKMLE